MMTRSPKWLRALMGDDDCSLRVWRERLSLDLVVKLWCALFSGVFFGLDFEVCFKMYSQQLDDEAPSQRVTAYLTTATLAELLFYAATIQFGRCWLKFDMMLPFVL